MAKRGVKRGRTHDAEGAREAILDAAEQVFAEHGFDGARVDAIAKTAGYNKSLIFQYYGDKLKLYGEVMRRADEQTRWMQTEALPAFLEAADDPSGEEVRKLLSNFVGQYYDYLIEHPNVLRMFLWEMAEGWQTYAKIVSQRDFEDMAVAGPILEKLRGAGMLQSDRLNPMIQVFSSLFVVHDFLGLLPVINLFFPGEDLSSPEAKARAKEYIVEFVVRGLVANPVASKA
jgi:TetR/AcrR family transcriptional regulator